ncbi:hypothetical protein MMC10_003904 [Thelotrema lepadinum]|nr:hypothetical protein [Thelotrema lepadinum]
MSPIFSVSSLSLLFLASLALATASTSDFPAGLATLRQRDAYTLLDGNEGLDLLLDIRDAATSSTPSSPPAKGASASGSGGSSPGTQSGGKTGSGSVSKSSASKSSGSGSGGLPPLCPCTGVLTPGAGLNVPISPIPMLKVRGLYPDAEQGVLGIRNFNFGQGPQGCRGNGGCG